MKRLDERFAGKMLMKHGVPLESNPPAWLLNQRVVLATSGAVREAVREAAKVAREKQQAALALGAAADVEGDILALIGEQPEEKK